MLRVIFILWLFKSGLSIYHYPDYKGESFPQNYFSPDNVVPTNSDLDLYIRSLKQVVNFFAIAPNETDPSGFLTNFYTKALLKRTLLDYKDKLQRYQIDGLKEIISLTDYVMSHYRYNIIEFGWEMYRVSTMLHNEVALTHTIGHFKRDRFRRWIHSNLHPNNFTKAFDELTLSKEEYGKLSRQVQRKTYIINVDDSDFCIYKASLNPEPVDISQLRPCHRDAYCKRKIHSAPSISYTLSHRVVNLIMTYNIKRCYFTSEEADREHMEQLCAFMYQESVYLARRGYFARDIFLEHVAICGMLGYEEFHRRHWFQKAVSWLTKDGCVLENRNFSINGTKLPNTNNVRIRIANQQNRCNKLSVDCHEHPTALMTTFLGVAIRHASHFMQN